MNRVKIITVLVLDQDAAIEFYTRKLGFELREDKPFGESRWVTISLPKNSDLTLALELAKTANDRVRLKRELQGEAACACNQGRHYELDAVCLDRGRRRRRDLPDPLAVCG